MSIGLVGFLSFMFIGATLINRIMEGSLLTATDLSVVNNILVWSKVSIFGWFDVPIPNLLFITEGLPHLVKWDYSFFGGGGAIMQYFLYSLSSALMVGLFLSLAGYLISKAIR